RRQQIEQRRRGEQADEAERGPRGGPHPLPGERGARQPQACGEGAPRHGAPSSQAGMVSSASIASWLGRARMTAKRPPSTSTSGTSGRLLYVELITAP